MARYVATVEFDAGQYWVRFPGIRTQDGGPPPASLDDALTEATAVPFEGTKLVIFDWDRDRG